ncbi:hypothetical protein ACFIOY_17450 [Bradyrhizobium sp. TZ2]
MILIVLAFHSVLPYLASLPPTPYPFDNAPYLWLAFPIIDSQRWFGFDLFCAWQDVGLMSLMFFLSGLFVPSSLASKGSWKFLSDRLLRIGLPMALAVIFFRRSPITPPIAQPPPIPASVPIGKAGSRCRSGRADRSGSWASYWRSPFSQPQRINSFQDGISVLSGWWRSPAAIPVRFLVVLVTISALAYIPLMLAYSPFAWVNIGPIAFQPSRPLHYLVYFLAGVAVGAYGLDRGLLDCDGDLARYWMAWLAAAIAGFLLWAAATSATLAD